MKIMDVILDGMGFDLVACDFKTLDDYYNNF